MGLLYREGYIPGNLIFPFIHVSRYLQNVRIEVDPGRPSLEFDADGTRSSVELKIVNLQPSNSGGSGRELLWRQVCNCPFFFFSRSNTAEDY
jgi:hypothetical protein